jgi:beta-galactosidase/beta-glucuronidase
MQIKPLNRDQLDSTGRGYPRPQLQRAIWYSLNGTWDVSLDPDATWRVPPDVQWSEQIQVPFAAEAPASGIGYTGFFTACWYRCRIDLPHTPDGNRWLLHFGAVDYMATVWINGIYVGDHEGGNSPFTLDITDRVAAEQCEIVVRAEDDPHDLAKPRGKQDWRLEPHSIWYPRTTGIWQTVWLECVPQTRIGRLAFTPNLARWEVGVEACLEGEHRAPLRLGVKLRHGSTVLAVDTYELVNGEVHRGIALSDPGIDDSRNELLWSPEAPTLLDVQVELWGERGELLEVVHSYLGLRSATVQGDKFLLNGRPYVLRMVLDQGYWPGGGLTASNDEALRRDVQLAREMGFNGVRKHQKIEDPRYLYWADRLGLAVWEEMPSAYRFTRVSVQRLSREWTQVIQRDYSHPCIIAWVPINESWGVPNLPDNPRERHYVQALYHLTKTLDPTRPVVGNDGWESTATDIIGIHDYDDQPDRIARRYHADDILPRLFKRERPGGRLLVLEGHPHADLPLMLTEFGGIALAPSTGGWGYSACATPEEFANQYEQLLDVVRNLGLLAGFCYTQFADTYQEANGLLYADRTPKVALGRISRATHGRTSVRTDGAKQIQSLTPSAGVRDA